MAIVRLQGVAEQKKGIYYEVDSSLEPIGEGGTGKVYEGLSINTRTGETRPVAIKFMFTDLTEQVVERARREATIQLRNDNLVEMLGFIETESMQGKHVVRHYHVVSELLQGVSLSDLFNGKCTDIKGREIPYAKKLLGIFMKDPDHFAKIITMNVLSGIMALHDAGYIHRDIDPSNVMITNDEHIKLIDFGICKQMKQLTTHDKIQTVAGVFMGKPEYAAPELALGDIKHQDQTTDIYAIGILMYQCIMGHVPFEGKRLEVLEKQLKQSVPVKNIKNAALRRVIEKACQKKQELRYQSSAEMRVAIESIGMKRVMDPRKRNIIIVSVVIALLLIISGFLGANQYKKSQEQQQTALIEKNFNDSLLLVIDGSVKQARIQADEGYRHDEGYDHCLINAKRLFDKADIAKAQLRGLTTVVDYSADKAKLGNALQQAYDELSQKADALREDPDSEVVKEVGNIDVRIREIESVMNQ